MIKPRSSLEKTTKLYHSPCSFSKTITNLMCVVIADGEGSEGAEEGKRGGGNEGGGEDGGWIRLW